jgi:serine/threonine-protein kinase
MIDDPAARRSRIDEIFSAALELPDSERERYLDSACKDETSLRAAVDRLLAASEEPCHFLEPGIARQGSLWHELSTELINGRSIVAGDHIGVYEIIRELGSGGMAVVYQARRADGQYEQEVALKILKEGRNSEDMTLRFHQERQILASLNHSGIARLIDGGVTRDGRPVIVMEQVDGEPIDAYCDRHRLTVEARLQLFVEVVRAVHYAHQNLVVHRDLKPSNILVTSTGQVKLLDFGIAKLLDHEARSTLAPETRSSVRVLTPEYASPEQVRGSPITTASDIYQLGLLLYELLSGSRAYRLKGRTPSEIERMICDQEPIPPSAGITENAGENGELPQRISELRQTRPERLRKRLAGDLDTIVLMALHKEPQRRYGTVEQLAQDIERHLVGLPVSARRSTFGYRLRKLIKRHTMAVASSLSMVLLIAAVIFFYTSRLADERDRARLEAEKANQVSTYLEGLFQATDSFQSRGEEISAAEMLDQEVRRVATELEDQPDLQVEMRILLANIYRRLGMFDNAGELLEQVVSAHSQLAGDEQLASTSSLMRLADIYFEQGRFDEAEPLYQQAIISYEKVLDSDDLQLADARWGLGELYLRWGKFPKAEAVLKQVVAVRELHLGEDHPLVIESRASLLFVQERFMEAEPLYHKALEAKRRMLGSNHVDVAYCLRLVGWTASTRGRCDEAERYHREELAILEHNFGPSYYDLGYPLQRLASCAEIRGQYREAGELFERTLKIQRETLGLDHPDVAATYHSLARFKAATGDFAAAEELELKAISIYEEAYGDSHTAVASNYNNLGYFALIRGLESETEAYCQRALEILTPYEGKSVMVATVLDTQACLNIDKGRLSLAESQLTRSIAIIEELLNADSPYLAEVLMNLARLRTIQGSYLEAAAHFDRALAIGREMYRNDPESLACRNLLASILVWQGAMYQQSGEDDRALVSWHEADILTEQFTVEIQAVAALSTRTTVLLRLGRVAEARPLAEKVLATSWRRSDLVELCKQHGL